MQNFNRRQFLRLIAGGAVCSLVGAPVGAAPASAKRRKTNVLFIAVDDLRPQLGCYGHKQIISPNIDKLAGRGTLFERAYCQQAVCAPSRASLLSGCRPDTTKIYDLETPLRKGMPDVLSLPQHFRKNGYQSISLGKIYHHTRDDRVGWSVPPSRQRGQWKGRGYLTKEAADKILPPAEARRGKYRRGVGPAFEAADVPDNAYPDGAMTDKAIEELRRLKDKPFFLAVGYVKPHLPFNAPKKYWDMYDPKKIAVPDRKRPKDAPRMAFTNWGELRGYADIPKTRHLDDALTRTLIQGYCACVSYIDALIGKLLGELDRLKLTDNTVIVLWGDHGWKLGDYGDWCKHTNFELDTHVPLIFAAPGCKGPQKCDALVEFVDIYPTLAELAGLEIPKHCEGTSVVPLMKDPKRKWKAAVFSQYPRGRMMGYSMRTGRWRYTQWRERRSGRTIASELYDHKNDPGETVNVADNAEHSAVLKKLSAQMKAGWKAARPNGISH